MFCPEGSNLQEKQPVSHQSSNHLQDCKSHQLLLDCELNMKDDHENALKTEAKNEFFAPEAKNGFFALDAEKLAFSTVFFMGENRLFDRRPT